MIKASFEAGRSLRNFCILVVMMALIAGCSGTPAKESNELPPSQQQESPPDSSASSENNQDQEPVNLKNGIQAKSVTITATSDGVAIDEIYINSIKELLKREYPHITLDFIQPGSGVTLENMVIAGTIPDLVFTHTGRIVPLKTLDLVYDTTSLVKQYNIDLSRFEKQFLDDVYLTAANGELYAFPLYYKFHALYYNKSIFEKFGVPYPEDGMTMQEAVELTRRVSRVEDGVNYRGLNTGSNIIWIAQPLSLFTVSEDKPLINTEGWRKMFEFGKEIYSIEGNSWTSRSPKKQFLEDMTLAMFLFQPLFDELEPATQAGLNWDLVQYPSFPENPNVFPSASTDVVMITNTSKNKEYALQVIDVLISEDLQMIRSKQGSLTVLKNEGIKQAFGQDLKYLEGKNLQSIFFSRPALTPPVSAFRQTAEGIVRRKFEDFLNGVADVNTILKMAEEEINAAIVAGQ